MKCNVGAIIGLIVGAMAMLIAAMATAYFWPTVAPLFIAAALVAGVAFGFIPAIKSALMGCPENCNIASLINTLSQAATILSFISFLAAAALQISALGFIASWFLALVGVAMEAAVAALVYTGIAICGIVLILFAGLLTQVLANLQCLQRAT